jgi:hypothetical protein
VTTPRRTPIWGEIEAFCRADEWELIRETDHTFYRKVLPNGEVLETHTSFSGGKTMSQDRFALILRTQLRVNRQDFWEAVRTGQPVERPSASHEPPPPVHEAWVVLGLTRYGVTEAEIAGLSPEEARTRLNELWAQPPRMD